MLRNRFGVATLVRLTPVSSVMFALCLSLGGCDRSDEGETQGEEDTDRETSGSNDDATDGGDDASPQETSGDEDSSSEDSGSGGPTSESGEDDSGDSDGQTSGPSEDNGGDDTGDSTGGDSDGDTSTDDTTDSTDEPTTDPESPSDYCKPVDDWDPTWVELENEVLEKVNQLRAKGADCGSEGSFAKTGPVELDERLRCAARVHSMDMGVREFFSHTNPDGESPFKRMKRAGFDYRTAGENIAIRVAGSEQVMQGWIESDGHCANLMNPGFKYLGVGYYTKDGSGQYRNIWTQNFGG